MDDRTASQAPLRARLIRWVPAVGWMAVIFTLSAQSDVRVTEDAGLDFVLRKAAHVTVFAILAMLLTWPLAGSDPPDGVRAVIAITILYAVSDELHQGTVAGRTASLMDVSFDAVGAVLGGLIVRWHSRPRSVPSSQRSNS